MPPRAPAGGPRARAAARVPPRRSRVADLLRAPGREPARPPSRSRSGCAPRWSPSRGSRPRAPAVVAQQRAQLVSEALVRARLRPRLLQLGQRRHQRLGNELPAVGAEAALDGGLGAVLAHTALSARASRRPWSYADRAAA